VPSCDPKFDPPFGKSLPRIKQPCIDGSIIPTFEENMEHKTRMSFDIPEELRTKLLVITTMKKEKLTPLVITLLETYVEANQDSLEKAGELAK